MTDRPTAWSLRNRSRARRATAVALAMSLPISLPLPASDRNAAADIEALAAEIADLRKQLAELDVLRERVAELERQLADASMDDEVDDSDSTPDRRDRLARTAVPESDLPASDVETAPDDGITLGGALRFNLFWNDFDEPIEETRGTGTFDLFRLGGEGSIGNFILSAEYRFYSFMDVLHHGWIGYEFEDEARLEFGVTKVPFGLLPYAAHNFWFGTPYYIGLSDDYDLGVKYVRSDGPWEWQAALFKNAELGSSASLERYSFDVVPVGETSNEETNQANLRASYTVGNGSACNHELGVSGQIGELYNEDTDGRGDHWAVAAHLDSRCGRWNIQLQAARYAYDPVNPPGVPGDTIRVGGFATSFDVASRASVVVANVAYNFPVPWEFLDQLTCYNDYSVVLKKEDRFRDSRLNTTGCLFGSGPIYVYADLIRAENMVFFGDGSLAGGGSDGWDTRFNVNVGFYW